MPATFLIVTLAPPQLQFVLIQHRTFIQLVTIRIILLKSPIAVKLRVHAVIIPFTAHDLRDYKKSLEIASPKAFFLHATANTSFFAATFCSIKHLKKLYT